MKFYIIKKLDDADSILVSKMVDRIRNVANAVQWAEIKDIHSEEGPQVGLFIAVGGDGTMLHAMRLSKDFSRPAICFNIGKLGFLAEFQPEQIEEVIIAIANNKYALEQRTLIKETVSNVQAVNEFVITPARAKDTIKYEFFINGVSSGFHKANGLIISTATGSTAYSLSVGGAILEPNAPVFQIVPIAAMSLNSRSVIVCDNSKISVKLKVQESVICNLIADGQVVQEIEPYEKGGRKTEHIFNFEKNQDSAMLMHGTNWNFFDVLHKKLRWNTEI